MKAIVDFIFWSLVCAILFVLGSGFSFWLATFNAKPPQGIPGVQ